MDLQVVERAGSHFGVRRDIITVEAAPAGDRPASSPGSVIQNPWVVPDLAEQVRSHDAPASIFLLSPRCTTASSTLPSGRDSNNRR
jgi:hypothetical protein